MKTLRKWGEPPRSRTVAYYHRRVAELVRARLEASGRTWEDAVWDPACELSSDDFQRLEDAWLATGARFQMSAGISVAETPEKYEAPVVATATAAGVADEQGRVLVGSGDNVFSVAADVAGTARFIGSVAAVMELLANGVPPDTIAIIDDSGGTLTAPILEDFAAVVCKGGTVRSHLGILTREYRIPCLMAAEISGLEDGARVEVEYSTAARTPYESDGGGSGRARVWKLP